MTHTIHQTKLTSALKEIEEQGYLFPKTLEMVLLTVSITTPDGVYMIDKKFVDEVREMSKSRFSLMRGKVKVKLTDEMLIALAIEENMVIERRDL